MGRNLPIAENLTIFHSLISTFFFFTLVFGSMFVVSSLCGTLYRRKRKKETLADENESQKNKDSSSQPDQSPDNNNNNNNNNVATTTTTAAPSPQPDAGAIDSESSSSQQPLPPPPGRRQLAVAASYHVRSESAASGKGKTDLASSLSMRVLGDKMKNINNHEKKKEKNYKHEDSIWKKTIILGDKCKVPDEDEDDPIVCDEKGNRISTYHKKNANSMALSRQGSAIDQDALNAVRVVGQNQNDDLMKQDDLHLNL